MFQYLAPQNLLHKKVVLVTGAGSGIGRTAALAYANYGASVILLGKNIDKLESVYDEITTKHYPKPAIYPLDLATTDDNEYIQLAETVENEFGKLDGLLHNAALLPGLKPISNHSTKNWLDTIQINLNAPFIMTRELLPLLRQSGTSSIIFTSSALGHKGVAHWGAYCVSKFAAETLMQILADEEDGVSDIRVNTITPGNTRTAMRAMAYPGEDPKTMPEPQEIMAIYLYLMGDDSITVSGKSFQAQIHNTNP